MQAVAIKPIDSTDFDAWLPLWRAYQRFYQMDIPEAVTRATWARFLDPAEPMHAVLAIVDGRAMGLAHAVYHRSTWTSDADCYLQDLFVADDARGGGVGRALIEHVHAEAKRRGAFRMHWLTHETNATAMRLYDRVADRSGFVQYRKRVA